MPSEATVFFVADAMLANGERPRLRKVREKLPTGGSPREICKHLRAWRKKRGYDPKLEPTDIPKEIEDTAKALAIDLWKRAKREATQKFSRERADATARDIADTEDREHLLGTIETLQADNAALVDMITAANAETARNVARLTKVENQLERFRAEEFWDRVMNEIFEILPVSGTMAPDEILPELRSWTIRGAALHKEPLTPAVIRKKMEVRITHGKYFSKAEDGRYARKAG